MICIKTLISTHSFLFHPVMMESNSQSISMIFVSLSNTIRIYVSLTEVIQKIFLNKGKYFMQHIPAL